MAGMFRKIKEDGRLRRTMAAWLGICIVVQMVFGSLGAVRTYAGDTIYKVITVSEKEIIKGVKRAAGKDHEYVPNIDRKKLPYANEELKDDAIDKITPFLMGTSIIEQKKAGDNCSVIVAVSGEELPASGSEAEYAAENVIFIGFNGNKDSDCVFTLQIVDANDIVIRSMTIITYKQDGAAATPPEASGSEATPSEDGTEPASPSAATSSTATGSEIQGYGFAEAGAREELGEDELTDLVQNGDISTPGEAASPGSPDDPKDAAGPRMTVPAGGFCIAFAESGTNAHGKIAQVQAFLADGEEKVMSGAIGTFHIAADYSVVDEKLPEYAYFTVRFKIEDDKGNDYGNVKGPESEPSARPVSSLNSEKQREWKAIHELLLESSEYADAAQCNDWQMITAETNTYFYSAGAGLAVFGIRNGGTAITDLPIFFTFDNYITPIGSAITATPGILNREELKEAYESSAGPAHSGDAALIEGEAVTMRSNARYWWHDVKLSNTGSLGNMAAGTNVGNADGEIIYKISAGKDYRSDVGRLYTKSYSVLDVIAFDGFALDISGYGLSVDASVKKGELYLTKDGRNVAKLIGLKLPGGYHSGEVKVTPVYQNNDSSTNIITGFEVRYTAENKTLATDGPKDMADIVSDEMNVYLGIGSVLKKAAGIIKYDGNAAVSGRNPSVSCKAYFDAYSIMYDETADNTDLEKNDGETNHHSEAENNLTANSAYPLTKEAYTDRDCKVEAEGENKIFEPGREVRYKIRVKNNGYAEERFDIVDSLPAGLDTASVKTLKVMVEGKQLPADAFTDLPANTAVSPAVKVWGNILIPSGGEAVVIFEAAFKSKTEFSGNNINTTQTNSAGWYRSSDVQREKSLGRDDATVFVNLNTLQESDVTFRKTIVNAGTGGSQPAVGSDVTYNLMAGLTGGVHNSHWITVKDEWPGSVTLKEISNIPSQAIIIIKENGTEIKRYENKGNSAASWSAFSLAGKSGITVEARVYLKPGVTENIKLKGRIEAEGEITNQAHAGGGEGEGFDKPGSATLYAIGASIEKKAYFIGASEKGSITEQNSRRHPVDQSVTFRAGDVVCYEMTLKNTGNDRFKANVSDDISNLFGDGIRPIYANADLGEPGSVFMKKTGAKGWLSLTPGQSGTKALDENVELAKGESIVFRIYLEIPEGASVLFPENTVSASLAYDKEPERKFAIRASASITINEDVQKASIDKEVYAVARELKEEGGHVYLKGAKWNNPVLGSGTGLAEDETTLTVGKGDYVFYRITINNESDEEPLRIYEIEDWLPAGMQFERFYEFNGADRGKKIPGAVGDSDTLDLGIKERSNKFSGKNWLYYEDAAAGKWGTDAEVAVSHGANFASMNSGKTTYRVRLYDTDAIKTGLSPVPSVKPGGSVVYGIIAKVTGDLDGIKKLTNTTGVIVDQTAITDEAFDRPVSDLSGAVGGKSYSDDLYKIITASADVAAAGIYTPGIGKSLAQYNASNNWYDYKPDGKNDNFLPNNPMRWQVTLYNGTNGHMTRGPIENYTIRDVFPAGLTYNEADADGTYIVTPGGKKIPLPEPAVGREEGKNVTASWKIEKQSEGYLITGADGHTVKTNENLAIPVKGKITVRIGSRADGDGTAKYGTYVNQADLIPAREYSYTAACEGTLVKEGNQPVCVRAEASVNIFFGDGKTEAWKEIRGSFNGTEGTGTGTDSSRNSIIADAGSEVTYTLNIRNQVEKGIENLVIVDRLPALKDNGLVNNMQRNSGFKVSFPDSPAIEVRIRKASGQMVRLKDGDYNVTFADWNTKFGKGSALPARYWEPDSASDWESSAAGRDTFRIEVENDALKGLTNNDTVIVTFSALLPKASELDLSNEPVAWNTFGYAYRAVNSTNKSTITVEPAKVGVRIPTASLAVTKKIESRFEEDKAQAFTFRLEKEDGHNTGKWVSAGGQPYQLIPGTGETASDGKTAENGEFTLTHGQTAKFTVLAGRNYRITERDGDGYYVSVREFGGGAGEDTLFDPENPPSAVLKNASDGKSYSCTFTNIRSSFFLPETGGAGTDHLRRKGAGMMLASLFVLIGCFTGGLSGRRRRKEDVKQSRFL